jgi:hypothetical protein
MSGMKTKVHKQKEEVIRVDGIVKETLPNAMFRVEIEDSSTEIRLFRFVGSSNQKPFPALSVQQVLFSASSNRTRI